MDNIDKSLEILAKLNKLLKSDQTDQLIQELEGLLTKEQQSFKRIKNILIRYRVMILDYMTWKSRYKYLRIVNNFSNKIISGEEFYDQFRNLYEKNQKEADYAETNLEFQTEFNLNSQIIGFSHVVDSISNSLELLDVDITDSQSSNFSLSENKLRLIISNNMMPKIQKYCEKNSEVSVYTLEVLDQIIWETQDEYIELLQEFLDDSNNFLNFENEYKSSLEWAENIKTSPVILTRNYQANGFSNFIRILIDLFNRYKTDSNISLNVLKYWIRKIICEMESHYS